jgi:NAD+ kinase
VREISIYNSFVKNNDVKREMLRQQLKQNGFTTSRNGDLLIVIGGDGTFLSAIRKRFEENPVFVGFNTGNLGFLSEFDIDKVDEFIKVLKRDDYWIQEFPVYEVRLKEPKHEIVEYFVNDLVIERRGTRILHMGVHVGEKEVCSISGDGLVLSTSLGSTGYGMSLGGAIAMDCGPLLQLNSIAPVQSRAYQSLSNTLLFKDDSTFTVFPNYKKQRPFRIVCDGKEIQSKNTRFVEVSKTKHVVRVLRSRHYDPLMNTKAKILDDE